jgi:hypothetical protein
VVGFVSQLISYLNPSKNIRFSIAFLFEPFQKIIKMLNYLMNQILYLGGAKKSILTYAPAVFGGQPFLKPFLKTSRLFELEAVDSKLQIFPGKFWS